MHGVPRPALARELTGPDRDRAYRSAAAFYPGFRTYEARAGNRRTPVIRFDLA